MFGDAPTSSAPATKTEQPAADGGLLDMDMMLGSSDPAPVVNTDNNNLGDMMDIFGGGPTAPVAAPV